MPKNTSRVLRPIRSDSQPPTGCISISTISAARLMMVPAMTSSPAKAVWIIFGPVTE
ncbi:hypothetical protein NB689_002186 [Xanthomonas sacchari]|nr:hypothetical protein [Xanthomonas sacchari]MCW0449670.1 hypothetical protein [Xanthomonas sacchari]